MIPYVSMCFPTASRYIKDTIKELIDDRKGNPPKVDKKILDKLISFSDDEERQLDDAVTFTIGGFHNNCKAVQNACVNRSSMSFNKPLRK